MPETVIPLGEGQTVDSEGEADSAQLTINWLVDSGLVTRLRPAIVNTQLDPGFYTAVAGPHIIGTYVWTSVFNRREYLVYVTSDRWIHAKDLITNVVTDLSTAAAATQLDGNATQVSFAEDAVRLIMAGGGQLQIWDGNPANLSTRIGPFVLGVSEPPTSATHVVSLNNYIIANNSALPDQNTRIFWSSIGDSGHLVWPPLNFNTADADSDPIVALAGNLREVFAFGTKTLQAFGIGSGPTEPDAFVSAAAITLGCIAPYSVVKRDADFAWLDDSRRFVISDGRAHEEIGGDIAKLIRTFAVVSDCFGFRLKDSYWDLNVWIFPTEKQGFAYDTRIKKWYQWRGWNGIDDYAGIRISSYALWRTGNLHIVGDPLFTNLWTLDDETSSDQGPGLPIVAERLTDRDDHGTPARKRRRKVRFYLKRGTATPEGLLDVMKKDDDGAWSGNQLLGLGVPGDYVSFFDWYPGGIYRRCQYRVRASSGVDVAIHSMVEFWEPMGD